MRTFPGRRGKALGARQPVSRSDSDRTYQSNERNPHAFHHRTRKVDLDEVLFDVARYTTLELEEVLVDHMRKRLARWQPDVVVPIGLLADIRNMKRHDQTRGPRAWNKLHRHLSTRRSELSRVAIGARGVESRSPMKVRLTKDFQFESAQTLPCAPEGHKCRQMHGHSFKVEISVEGEVDKGTGWFYDHAEISKVMRPIVEQLDHGYLNEVPGLENPTIENVAAWFWKKLEPHLPGLAEIVVHETPSARCTYRGE